MAEDQRERQIDPWSAHAAEGISSTSLGDRDQAQEIRELRQQVQDLTGVLRPLASRNDSFPNAKSNLTGSINSGRVGKTVGGTTRSGPRAPQWPAGGTTHSRVGLRHMAHRFVARASLGTPRGSLHGAPAAGPSPGFSVPDGSGGALFQRGVSQGSGVVRVSSGGSLPGAARGRSSGWLVLQPKLVDLLVVTLRLASSSCKACST